MAYGTGIWGNTRRGPGAFSFAFTTFSADFSATPLSGTLPLTVSFTDLTSSGTPSIWSWDFGDGFTSATQHPVHTYNNAGTYTVVLSSSDGVTSASETKSSYITVSENNFYVDFDDLTTGNVGTQADPFSYEDMATRISSAVSADTFYCKGLVETSASLDANNNHFFTMDAWDVNQFGPWRINFSTYDAHFHCRRAFLKKGIIHAKGHSTQLGRIEDCVWYVYELSNHWGWPTSANGNNNDYNTFINVNTSADVPLVPDNTSQVYLNSNTQGVLHQYTVFYTSGGNTPYSDGGGWLSAGNLPLSAYNSVTDAPTSVEFYITSSDRAGVEFDNFQLGTPLTDINPIPSWSATNLSLFNLDVDTGYGPRWSWAITRGHIGSFYFGDINGNTSGIPTLDVSAVLLVPDVTVVNAVSSTVGQPQVLRTRHILLQPTVYSTQDIEVDFVGVPVSGPSPLVVEFTAIVKYSAEMLNKYKVTNYSWCFDYDYDSSTCNGDWVNTESNSITHVYTGYNGKKYSVKVCVTLALI